jgi:hypothetical protein
VRAALLLRAEARDDAGAQDGRERLRGAWRGSGRWPGSPSPARRGGGGERQLGGGNAHRRAASRGSDKAAYSVRRPLSQSQSLPSPAFSLSFLT